LTGFLMVAFVFTMLFISGTILFELVLLKFGLIKSAPDGLAAQQLAASAKPILGIWNAIIVWSVNLSILIADGIIVWRAYALWLNHRIVKWILIVILLADIALTFADTITDTVEETLESNSILTLDYISVVVSLIVNIVATSLIAYRAWTYYRSTRSISTRNKRSQVEAILLLCIESGAILGIVQLLTLILQALDIRAVPLSPITYATGLFSILYAYTVVLNPLALVILVQTENTYESSYHSSRDLPTVGESLTDVVGREDIAMGGYSSASRASRVSFYTSTV